MRDMLLHGLFRIESLVYKLTLYIVLRHHLPFVFVSMSL